MSFKKIKYLSNNFKKNNKLLNIKYNEKILKLIKNENKKLKKINIFFKKWKYIKINILNIYKILNNKKYINLIYTKINKKFKKIKNLEKKIIKHFLIFKNNKDNCFLEIRSATGGDEASLFSKKLFYMYHNYSETKNWEFKIININKSEQNGYKEIILKIYGLNVYDNLKFESGGHRVQRVPKTESQGRIHTSTCTIAILKNNTKSKQNIINYNNIKIDTFKSSGAGGQHVNTTDSAVRITHIPTNIIVECQNERSQHKNKSRALEILFFRIKKLKLYNYKKDISIKRKTLLGSGNRSDRIRTYNFQKNRITDHRINLNLYCLKEIINGNLDILLNFIKEEYKFNKLYKFFKTLIY